jgi:hypothetical protein
MKKKKTEKSTRGFAQYRVTMEAAFYVSSESLRFKNDACIYEGLTG